MNKYAISLEVPVIQIEVHEFEVEADSPQMAMLQAQGMTFTEDTLFKTKANRTQSRGPYKVNACRRLLEEKEV